MLEYRDRAESRNSFRHSPTNNHTVVGALSVVRRVGPRWVIAGRRPRNIPVFNIIRTVLPAPRWGLR
jgi:hypothetical protein